MAVSSNSPSKFWAYLAVVVGAILLLLGAGTLAREAERGEALERWG